VITNANEMGCDAKKVLDNVMSCEVYKKAFTKFKKLTPFYPEVNLDHIVSAITLYYSDFSNFSSRFDRAMNGNENISTEAIKGFNLFMSKAQCATCHFVPQFNGVKPPYIGSEFEVLGVPGDTSYKYLSGDSGRYKINEAAETMHAFRTGSIRNSSFTKPYMHNGIFNTMDEVIDFYDAGGGSGKGLKVDNQTLSPDSLHLTKEEKNALKAFIKSLDENIIFQKPPDKLPETKLAAYKRWKPGGEY
jgi:cytochrome c peroxidase